MSLMKSPFSLCQLSLTKKATPKRAAAIEFRMNELLTGSRYASAGLASKSVAAAAIRKVIIRFVFIVISVVRWPVSPRE